MFRETPSGYSTHCSRPANALMSAALPPRPRRAGWLAAEYADRTARSRSCPDVGGAGTAKEGRCQCCTPSSTHDRCLLAENQGYFSS